MHATPDNLFAALADPTRRRIFEWSNRDGEQAVRALTDHGGASQPAASRHAGVPRLAGPVRDRRAGRGTHDGADPKGLAPRADWLGRFGAFRTERFDKRASLLDRMD